MQIKDVNIFSVQTYIKIKHFESNTITTEKLTFKHHEYNKSYPYNMPFMTILL